MSEPRRHGTQTIERAVLVLKELATRGGVGWRLSDLAAACGLDMGTAHRIVACLIRERLAYQRVHDRRYLPGPLLFELGLSLTTLNTFQTACHAPLAHLAKQLDAIALLYLRSGSEFVCVARAGAVELKALTIDVGTRRPLIVSAGGLAILIALRKDEIRAITAANLQQLEKFSEARIRALKRVLRNSKARGYGVSESDIVPGISAYGMCVRDSLGQPFASLSIVGHTEDFPASRMPEVVQALEHGAGKIEQEARKIFSAESFLI